MNTSTSIASKGTTTINHAASFYKKSVRRNAGKPKCKSSELGIKKTKFRCDKCDFYSNEIGLLKGMFFKILS